ncbi:MAG: hypothetical protein JO331_06285 [Verrucomicrobia bacterium]|nr:hypothetical protein [Verrucomicrobiota bacterium]
MKQCLLALATACGLVTAVPTAVQADSLYVYPGGVRVYRGYDDRDYWAWRRHEWRERHWREYENRERWRERHEYPYRWRDQD